MDDICHDSPNTEIIALGDFNLGVLGIGRTQFLIDRNGNVVERFEPTTSMEIVEEKIKELL